MIQLKEEHFLNDNFIIRFHNPFNEEWSKESYEHLHKIDTIESFWRIHNLINNKIHLAMLFLFREHIFPVYEDDNNINGGCISMKVLKEKCGAFWENLSIKLLSETLLKPQKRDLSESICGISVSPKKTFCIIKIWLKNKSLNNPDWFDIPKEYHGSLLFKNHEV